MQALVLPLRVEERPTTGSPKADRMIEKMVMDAMTKLAPVIAEEIIKSLKTKIDIIK